MTVTRTFGELRRLQTFNERFDYLAIKQGLGDKTFGVERYLNQRFYRSRQWRLVRDEVIARDNGLDLGIPGRDIHHRIVVHHMNPMTIEDVDQAVEAILDPRFLITTSHETHNAIHYGSRENLSQPWEPRRPGDTDPWYKQP